MGIRYVSRIQNGKIQTSENSDVVSTYSNDDELVLAVKSLIKKGFAFVDEPAGWPPAAVLQDIHAKGLLDTSFTAITWSQPNQYRTYEIRCK